MVSYPNTFQEEISSLKSGDFCRFIEEIFANLYLLSFACVGAV